ncbi:MAG: MerR family transcriptional regulator [Candidatus Riflebacteria bacterium]|nr:MerR family transcriptional regulator [Candidatus Riflebacteria bacterium]
MAERLTIAEVGRLTGLASHTIRFYEHQFPKTLDVERTPGGHRQYRARHVEALHQIVHLVKHEKLSIREAQARLGEETPASSRGAARADAPAVEALQQSLTMVLGKLEELCCKNAHLDTLVANLLQQAAAPGRDALLAEIARYREENRRAVRVYEEFLQRGNRLDEPLPTT